MSPLTESEKSELIRLLSTGQPLPEQWRYRLFPSSHRAQETGKEYAPDIRLACHDLYRLPEELTR